MDSSGQTTTTLVGQTSSGGTKDNNSGTNLRTISENPPA